VLLGSTGVGLSAKNRLWFIKREEHLVHNEFTAIIERDGDWYIGYCPQIAGANGQGITKEDAFKALSVPEK